MNKNCNLKYFYFLLMLISGRLSVYSSDQDDQLKAMKWVKRTIQYDIDNIIRPTLLKSFTTKERMIAQNIGVNVVLDTRFSRVRAFTENNIKSIEISTGFLSLIGSLIDANIISTKIYKTEKLSAYNILISNYIRNYQNRVSKGLDSSWPGPFYKFIGIDDATYDSIYQSKEYDQIFSLNMRVVLSYILAHEYAHHILGHLTIRKPNDSDESVRNEDEADDFSIRVNWMLGNNPLPIANYFMLFSIVEGSLFRGTHSPSACRLEKFLQAGIYFSKTETQNKFGSIPAQQLKALEQIEKGHAILKTMCEKGQTMTNTSIPGLW